MNKYLKERRRIDEFDDDIYSERYLDEEDAEDYYSIEELGFMSGYNDAE